MDSTWLVAAGVGTAATLAAAALLFSIRKPQPVAVATKKASPAGGHYSQAIIANGLVFVSGLLPITPQGDKLAKQPFAHQVRTVFANLDAILEEAGTSRGRLVSVRVYVCDIELWGQFNQLYAEWLGEHKPARCVVPVPVLHYGLALEMEAVCAQ